MPGWDFVLELDRNTSEPLFRQIARAITEEIRRGRLRPSDRLPGTRTLAASLGVQRLTVVAAFEELAAEGWIDTHQAKRATVSPELPERRPRRSLEERSGVPERFILAVPAGPPGEMPYDVPRGALFFAPNRPDVRLLPHDLIGRAYRRSLRRGRGTLLTYGRPQGHERLRRAIAEMLSATRGLAAGPDDVCITRGSQMALALLARTLIRPGDLIAVEEVGYPPALTTFRMAGAAIAPLPVDEHGLNIEALEKLLREKKLRALYMTPHHQFPTTVTLSAPRRLRLLGLAKAHRFAIIEEDYDHEFHYDGHPVLPLASADTSGVVAYVGSFSKVLAPALRIGFVVAPRPLLAELTAHRIYLDVQGDRVLEHAIGELMEDGEVQRHIRRVRREYAARRDVLVEALRRWLPEELNFAVPSGGIGLWVESACGLDIDAWAQRARGEGAIIATARTFSATGRALPYARLGFAALDRRELAEGVRRLARARKG